jgi:ABC-type lipoprotein export system ATPase subunit/bifunctional DNA-binding transcriptional regulator/antitoxin component of YhaV-PrlF toxin-antitoxin module
MEPIITCDNLVKIYRIADLEVMALQGLDLKIYPQEVMAIIGASGSGKSTLLNILGGLDEPTAGSAVVAGWNLGRLTRSQRLVYMREIVGFVWQNVARNLVPYLTAEENVLVPMILNGKTDRAWARELLEAVGLGHRIHHRPLEMSGGEQQRVAIAIALANRPKVLLADEPTGALDTRSSRQVLEVFHHVSRAYGVTVVIVTHDRNMAYAVDRFIEIRDGKTSVETVRRRPLSEGEHIEKDEESHDEYVVLDSAGRLQIPPEYREALGIGNRLRVEVEDGKIVLKVPEAGQSQEDSPEEAGEQQDGQGFAG